LGPGVKGVATGGRGTEGWSTSGEGVFGQSTSGTGVWGQTEATGCCAILGFGPKGAIGVDGRSELNGALLTESGIGVVGRAFNENGAPPYADASFRGAGVYGESSATTGAVVAIGVGGYGVNQGGDFRGGNTGIAVEGGVHANGLLTGGDGRGIVAGGNGAGVQGSGVYGYNNTQAAGYYGGYFLGNLYHSGTFDGPSDIRLKHDIAPLIYGLDAIKALSPVSYAMNDDVSNTTRLGLIGQEVREVIPELVGKDPETDMLSMRYLELIPVLIKAIQEQQAQIEALRTGSEPRPSGALNTAPKADSPSPAPPQVAIVRQSVGPSNAVLLSAGTAVAMGMFAVAGALVRRRPRIL
jgi:hypothetical protein